MTQGAVQTLGSDREQSVPRNRLFCARRWTPFRNTVFMAPVLNRSPSFVGRIENQSALHTSLERSALRGGAATDSGYLAGTAEGVPGRVHAAGGDKRVHPARWRCPAITRRLLNCFAWRCCKGHRWLQAELSGDLKNLSTKSPRLLRAGWRAVSWRRSIRIT